MSRILFVSTCYPDENSPQYCIFLEQQARALVETGNKVDVLVPTESKTYTCDVQHKIQNNIKVYYFNFFTLRYGLLKEITTRNFHEKLKELLMKKNYDFISVHLGPDWVLEMIVNICSTTPTKVIAHYHGLNVWNDYTVTRPLRSKIIQYKRKKIIDRVDGIVGVSNKVSEIVSSLTKNKNVYTVYNGVDTNIFKPLAKPNDVKTYNIICVANLIKIKGQKHLILAVKKLIEENNSIKINLKLVGRGPEEVILRELVKELKMEKNVNFMGYVNYKEVAELIANSDVFVMPSYYEALGCVYLEAMATRLPTIGVIGQGIEEVIKDGENGFLIHPQSSDSIYETLKFIYNHKEEVNKVACNGYDLVVNNFQWIHSAKQLMGVYNKIGSVKKGL